MDIIHGGILQGVAFCILEVENVIDVLDVFIMSLAYHIDGCSNRHSVCLTILKIMVATLLHIMQDVV